MPVVSSAGKDALDPERHRRSASCALLRKRIADEQLLDLRHAGVTLDLTVTTETTVSGSYGGVDAEEKLTTEFGVSTSKEETHDKATEGTSDSGARDRVRRRTRRVLSDHDHERARYHLPGLPYRRESWTSTSRSVLARGHDPVGRQDKYYPGSPVKWSVSTASGSSSTVSTRRHRRSTATTPSMRGPGAERRHPHSRPGHASH